MDAVLGAGELRAIAITGQYGSTVPVDARGEAAGPCFLWPTRVAGQKTPGQRAGPSAHEHLLRTQLPEIDRRTTVLLEPVDYLGLCFTGVARATPASMMVSRLVRLQEAGYDAKLVEEAGRDPSRLPELIPTGSILGGVSAGAARELGIAEGTPVVAGIPDLHSAYLGSGALAVGCAHQVLSSTAWMGLSVERPYGDAAQQLATVPGIAPDHLLIENAQRAAGIALDWLVNLFYDDVPEGAHTAIGEAATRVPPGAGGVIFAPWLNGERSPLNDNRLRGGLIGLTPASGRAEIARAVLEGIALNSRLLLESLRQLIGLGLGEITVLGRCSELNALCQISADVLGVPIHRVAEPASANLRGTAMFGALALGRITLADAESWVQIERTFAPDSEASAKYDEIFETFRRLPDQLPAGRSL
jgi:xylulokinase